MTEETKNKISLSVKNYHRKNPGKIGFKKGKENAIYLPGARAYLKQIRKGMNSGDKNPAKRPEIRKKISQKLKGRKTPWSYKIRGKNHYNFRGQQPLVSEIRNCFKYREWRSSIYKRDNFTCILCKQRGKNIEADHYPKRFIDVFEENNIKSLEEALNCKQLWDINNGRTLCKKCHLNLRKIQSKNRKALKI